MKRIVTALAVAATLQVGAADAAAAATPAAYRTQLNRICRSYTPRFHALDRDLKAAVKAKDGVRYGRDLGQVLVLALLQDAQIQAVSVPLAMRAQMTPIRRTLRVIDAHARAAVTKAQRQDGQGMLAELQAIQRLTPPLNKQFDRAGLRDCGSNQ